MKFNRGVIVHHKVMGKGVVLNKIDKDNEKKIEVRMENGVLQQFYPEELETQKEVQARNKRISEEINKGNENRWEPYD